MATLFLLSIFLSFAGQGLYNPMLGVVWPVAHVQLGAAFSSSMFVTLCITANTISGTLLSPRISKKLGVGRTVFLAMVGISAVCFGFSRVPSLGLMILLAIPLGFFVGLNDSIVNNYVAQNYKPHVISWLHAFWGVGAMIAPNIAAFFLKKGEWRGAYTTISVMQIAIAALLLLMIPQWNKQSKAPVSIPQALANAPDRKVSLFSIPGAVPALLAMFCYGGVETSTANWGASFLTTTRGISPDEASRWVALFFTGLMVARLLTGFLSMRFTYQQIIRVSQATMIVAALLLLVPLNNSTLRIGFGLLGLGCGPFSAGMVYLAGERFGPAHAQRMIGLQMAASFTGNMILPPITGIIGGQISMLVLPIVVLLYSLVSFLSTTYVNRVTGKWTEQGA